MTNTRWNHHTQLRYIGVLWGLPRHIEFTMWMPKCPTIQRSAFFHSCFAGFQTPLCSGAVSCQHYLYSLEGRTLKFPCFFLQSSRILPFRV